MPKSALLPMIVILSAVGSYAIENNPVHIYWMLGFGVAGYFLKMYGYQVGPVILGIILGPLLDANYRRAMISVSNDPVRFVLEFFTSPVSLTLFLLLTLTVVSQTRFWAKFIRLFKRGGAGA
jgi:putative tricarboxylic transport membrane protein